MSYLADKQAVERGARLLDEHRPGWHNEVSPDQLDVDSEEACVLGQLYGTFLAGREALFTASDSEKFILMTGHTSSWNHGFVGRDAAQLTKFWREQIAARRLSQDTHTV